jgi:hypothetical protein
MRKFARLRLPVPTVPNLDKILMYLRPTPSAGAVCITTFRGQPTRQWNRWGDKNDKSPPVTDFFAAPPPD